MKQIAQKFFGGSAVIALSVLMLTALDAGAADRTTTLPDITVKFTDVQLNSEADAEALYKKLRSAARGVCDDNAGGHRSMEVRTRAEKCVNAVLADAVRKIDKPLLTAVHESKTNKSGEVG